MGKKTRIPLPAGLILAGLLTCPAAGVNVWYDFESASPFGPLSDKLVGDGAQDVGLYDMFPFTAGFWTSEPLHGTQSLRLRAHNPVRIPTPLNLGPQVTFAAKVRYVFGGVRDLFGNYGGAEAPADTIVGAPGQMRISFEPRGNMEGVSAEGQALRFIFFRAEGNIDVSANADTIASWGLESGEMNPHHLAVTYNDGEVKLYFDGVLVGTGGAAGAGNLDLTPKGHPLVFGGVHPWEATPGLMATTPVCGDIDDVLVLRRVLSPEDVATLAAAGAAALALTETTAGEVLYDMEGDAGHVITDKLNQISADDTPVDERLCSDFAQTTPMFGDQYLRLECFSAFPIPGTRHPGAQVTLAAHLRDVPGGIRYLMTNSSGAGLAGEAILWINSLGTSSGQALRFLYWDSAGNLTHNVEATAPIPDWSRAAGDTNVHHVACTWDDGVVSLYFDGQLVGSGGSAGAGNLDISVPKRLLRFGGRSPVTSDAANDNNFAFEGDADDVLVLRRVLTPAQIQTLASAGAAALGLTEAAAGEVLYDMEGDSGDVVTDKLNTLSAQNAPFDAAVEMMETPSGYVSDENPLFGGKSAVFEAYSAFPIPSAVDLGTKVTLAAHVRDTRAGLRLLMSNYDGFDLKGDFWLAINASGAAGQSVWFRWVGPTGVLSVTNNEPLPPWSREAGDGDAIHHVAATYDDGVV
ncbi:MAG: hypothetical protein HRF43_03205, partial [Phycisphaerae bacterium]